MGSNLSKAKPLALSSSAPSVEAEVLTSVQKARVTAQMLLDENQGKSLSDLVILLKTCVSDALERHEIFRGLIEISDEQTQHFLEATDFDPLDVIQGVNDEYDQRGFAERGSDVGLIFDPEEDSQITKEVA